LCSFHDVQHTSPVSVLALPSRPSPGRATISGMSSARFFGTGKWMLLDNYLIRALTGDHSAYQQQEAEATQCTQTGYAPVNGLEAFHNWGWGAVDAVASPRLRFQRTPSGGL
jgi:hypothetical protein